MSKVILNEQEPAYILSPVNLDRALQELQRALKQNIPWLSRAYGRARVMPEKVNDKTVTYPKVYYRGKEYLNVLLNDTVNASSWFQVMTPETPLDYHPSNTIQKYQVQVAAIFWFNLELLKLEGQDYYHSEVAKREIHNLLGRYPNVTIQRVYDEHARDIFREYTTEVDKEQFLSYPKAGLRFEFLLTYNYDCTQVVTTPKPEATMIAKEAGENLSANRLVKIIDNKAYYFDANTEADYGLAYGITITSAPQGSQAQIVTFGEVVNLGAYVPNVDYYGGLNGALVTDPTGLKIVQPIGKSIDGNKLFLDIDNGIITI